jgi:hypothetical protein
MSVLEAPPKDTSLKGLSIIELDKNNDVFVVWYFGRPCTTLIFRNHPPNPQLDKLAVEKSEIVKYTPDKGDATTYTKFKDKWVYILTTAGEEVSAYLVTFSICLYTDVHFLVGDY